MIPIFPLKVFKDREDRLVVPPAPLQGKGAAKQAASSEPRIEAPPIKGAVARGELSEVALTLSGFGGQGVLFAGLALAEGRIARKPAGLMDSILWTRNARRDGALPRPHFPQSYCIPVDQSCGQPYGVQSAFHRKVRA